MTFILVIIFVVIGMIAQGNENEKGCGWSIVACILFLYFLFSVGVSGEDAATILLWVIGLGFVGFILWSISKTIEQNNNTKSQTKNINADKELHQPTTVTKASCLHESVHTIETDMKQIDTEHFKERQCETIDENSYITENNVKSVQVKKHSKIDERMKSAKKEFEECDSLKKIIETYVLGRSSEQILNPLELGILTRYITHETDYYPNMDLYRSDMEEIIRKHLRNTRKDDSSIINTEVLYEQLVNSLKCLLILKKSDEEKNQYIGRTEFSQKQNYEEDKELIEIEITQDRVEIDLLYESEKISIQENTDDMLDEIPLKEKRIEQANVVIESPPNLYECKIYDFSQNVIDYINTLEDFEKERIVYDETNTNITRFKKAEKEYSEKLLRISKQETNLDENSQQFKRFINDKVSGDLRAIDNLCSGNSDYSNGYAVWSNLVDEGKLYFPVSSTYANVIMHQIINRLLVKSPYWALIIMIDLWNHYYPDFQHKEILMWIKDFWVTYCCEISYQDFKKLFKLEIEFQGDSVMDAIDSVDVSYLNKSKYLDFFNENCNYKIKTGRTVQEGYENILELCLGETVTRLQLLFNEHKLKLEDYFQIYDEEEVEKLRDPFRRAILTNQTINNIVSNVNNREVGSYEIYNAVANSKDIKFLIKRKRYTYFKSRLFIENIGKVCELFLRDWLGIPAKFIVNMEELCEVIPGLNNFENKDNNEIIGMIRGAVEFICRSNDVQQSKEAKTNINYLRDNKPKARKNDDVIMNEKQQFNIDISKLDKIRSDAELIQEKLIVDEEGAFQAEESDIIQVQEMSHVITQILPLQNTENDDWQELFDNLLSYELQALSIIFNQVDTNLKLEELCKKSGLLVEVMIEGLNEKALEIIGDNLIESRNHVPIIFQDYISDISKLLQEET